jgi:hypothetical protein
MIMVIHIFDAQQVSGYNKPKHCRLMKIFHNCAETGENLSIYMFLLHKGKGLFTIPPGNTIINIREA